MIPFDLKDVIPPCCYTYLHRCDWPSTALVCLRYALTQAAAARVLTPGEAGQLLATAVAMPFTRRSWTALSHAAATSGLTGACDRLLAWRATAPAAVTDIKAADAQLALRLISAGQLPAVSAGGWGGRPWRTSHLRRWAATYRPVIEVDSAQVPFLPALQHAPALRSELPGSVAAARPVLDRRPRPRGRSRGLRRGAGAARRP